MNVRARRVARELALLGVGQLSPKAPGADTQTIASLLGAAVQTLTSEVHEQLERAAAQVQQGRDLLADSETKANSLPEARARIEESLSRVEVAINLVSGALELPEVVQMANQTEVRAHSLEILQQLTTHWEEVDGLLSASLVDWQLHRLARIDQDILRIAITEMLYLQLPVRVAVNEAVELAKRYSGPEGYRFVNGVLRRVVNALPLGVS